MPEDLAVDRDGNVYIAGGSRIRKLTPARTAPPKITSGPRNIAGGLDKVSPGTVFCVEGENLAASSDMVTAPPLAHDNGWSFDDDQGNSRAAQHGRRGF